MTDIDQIPNPWLQEHYRIKAEAEEAARRHRARSDYGEFYQTDHEIPPYDPSESDPYLIALRDRQGKSPNHELSEVFRFDEDDPRRLEWRERRDSARSEVEMREKVGLPVSDELRARANEEDRFYIYEGERARRAEQRANSLARVRL